MRDPQLERAVLKLAFETDVPLTPAAVAYHLDCQVDVAKQQLEALLHRGVLLLDSDEEGNLYYSLPERPVVKTTAPLVPQRGTERRRRLRRWAVAANVVLPGLGTLAVGRPGLALCQAGLAVGAWSAILAFWKDLGDAEHRFKLALLLVAYIAAVAWAVICVLRTDPSGSRLGTKGDRQ